MIIKLAHMPRGGGLGWGHRVAPALPQLGLTLAPTWARMNIKSMNQER